MAHRGTYPSRTNSPHHHVSLRPPPQPQALNGISTSSVNGATVAAGGLHHILSPAPPHASSGPSSAPVGPSSSVHHHSSHHAGPQPQHNHPQHLGPPSNNPLGPPPPQMLGPVIPGGGPPPVAFLNGNGNGNGNGFLPQGSSSNLQPPVQPMLRGGVAVPESLIRLAKANEDTWMTIGDLAERLGDLDTSVNAFEHALRHNPKSIDALTRVAAIARGREELGKAITHWQRVVELQPDNGEVWSAMGHCFLMQDDLQKAYMAYQQALYFLPNPKDPKLWYGIGILYDRYGSLDHAEEAFTSTLSMDPDFEKADEIYFRLGIIYKQQQKYNDSLDCFNRILRSPPLPLATIDIWFQIGHVYEQMKDFGNAKNAYEHVLEENPNHAKVLQQLGWLYHQPGTSFSSQDLAIQYLTRSLESDGSDAQSWYLLGRAYMAVTKYQKAYEAYQQAVYRDGRNPTFWCSIGVLYFQINQYRDALDAYSRAIKINPYISEVWFDLGSLYESCNNQISDAIDAYGRAADLDQSNPVIKQRLALLREAQRTGGALPAAPGPQDVHPTAYATVGPPTMFSGAAAAAMVGASSSSGNNGGAMSNGNGGLSLLSPGPRNGVENGRGEVLPMPRMGSAELRDPRERDLRGGPHPMEGVEQIQQRGGPGGRGGRRSPFERSPPPIAIYDERHPRDDRERHRERDLDRERERDRRHHHRTGNGQQLAPMDIDKPYPGVGPGASGVMPSVRPVSRENGNGIALHHPQPQSVVSPIPQHEMHAQHRSNQSGSGPSSLHGIPSPAHPQGPPPNALPGMSRGRRSPALSDRAPSPPRRRHGAHPQMQQPVGPGGPPASAPFSNQLPPPPSTLVTNPPAYYQGYPDSPRSRTPSDRDIPPGRGDPSWRGAPPDRERERERERVDRRRDRASPPPHPQSASGHRRGPPGPPQGYYPDERDQPQQHQRAPRGYDPARMGSPPPRERAERERDRDFRDPRDPRYRSPPPEADPRYTRRGSPDYDARQIEEQRYRAQQQQQQQQLPQQIQVQQQQREDHPPQQQQQHVPPPSSSRRYDPRFDAGNEQPPPPQHSRHPSFGQQGPPPQVSGRHEPGWERPSYPQEQPSRSPHDREATPPAPLSRRPSGASHEPPYRRSESPVPGRVSLGGGGGVSQSQSQQQQQHQQLQLQQSQGPPDSAGQGKERKKRAPKNDKDDKANRDRKDRRSGAGSVNIPTSGPVPGASTGANATGGRKKLDSSPILSATQAHSETSAVSSTGGRRARGSATPGPRGAKKDSPDDRTSHSSLPSPPPASEAPRREVDEDYDDAAEALVGLATQRPPVPGRQNSIASLVNRGPSPNGQSSDSSRNMTPKRPRPNSPDISAANKRTRIEILNAPSIAQPQPQHQTSIVLSAAPGQQLTRSPSPQAARRLTPIHMASRAPSTMHFRSAASSASPTPPPDHPPVPNPPVVQIQTSTISGQSSSTHSKASHSPSPTTGLNAGSSNPPSAFPSSSTYSEPGKNPLLPDIATLSPPPPSPKQHRSGDENKKSPGGVSDMLVDSDQSRSPSAGANRKSSGSRKYSSSPLNSVGASVTLKHEDNDAMAVDGSRDSEDHS